MKYFTLLFLLLFSHTTLANKCIDLMQKEDFYEASEVCRTMADKGEKNAQFALAVMYHQGSGMMADTTEAKKWMRKAALQNHNQAQYNLGIMIANGQGGPVDLVEAYAWLRISDKNGYPAAADSVKQLGNELSSDEKKQSDERVNNIIKSLKTK